MAHEKSPAYQHYPKDYLTDSNVAAMTLEQEGAYRRLLDFCWLDGSLPNDLSVLARLCRVTPKRMAALWPPVAICFRPHPDDPAKLIHPRLERERTKQAAWRDKSSEAGTRSARLAQARKVARHSQDQWLQLVAQLNMTCPRCRTKVEAFHKDHVVPLYLGGSDGIDNIQPLCQACNLAKGSETVDYIAHLRGKVGCTVVEPNGNFAVSVFSSQSTTLSKNPPKSPKGEYTEGFLRFWAEYPRRAGENSKALAFKAWNARIAQKHTEAEMIAGCKRYHAFCFDTGKIGTEYVKMARSFLGNGLHFKEEWATPPKKGIPEGSPAADVRTEKPQASTAQRSGGLRHVGTDEDVLEATKRDEERRVEAWTQANKIKAQTLWEEVQREAAESGMDALGQRHLKGFMDSRFRRRIIDEILTPKLAAS